MFQLKVEHLSKSFSFRQVIKDINFTIQDGDCLVITGKNGSGKTTLLKILSNLLRPDSGRIALELDGKTLNREDSKKYVSLVSPEVMLYDELTAVENLKFLGAIGGISFSQEELLQKIRQMGLEKREDDLLGSYSTGMKQRIKLVFALLNQPKLLLLDEPGANLDEEGLKITEKIIEQQKTIGISIWLPINLSR
ncbi:MAG: ATP-binding cassette domain-containing protein [candidate division Zixibacteria bacterium]|nr:ATP-binding cassette domain-containing protein [candidate division Zixibacteria bacterium]